MKKQQLYTLILASASFLLISEKGLGQTPQPGPNCEEAPLVCGATQTLWSGNNAGAAPGPVGIDCPMENTQWLRFAPCETMVTIEVSASQCNSAMGIELAVVSSDDCQQFTASSSCMPVFNATFETLTFDNLIPGEIYYLVIDGLNGDFCDFEIIFVNGINFDVPEVTVTEVTPGYIDGPSSVCLGETATYTLVPPVTEFNVTGGSGGCALPAEVCNSSGDTITFDIVWHAPPGAIFVSDSVNVMTVDIMFNDTIDGFVWVELVPNILPGNTPPDTLACDCITVGGPLSPIAPAPVDVMYTITMEYVFLDCYDPYAQICGVTYFFSGSDVITCQVYCGFEIYNIFYDDTPIPNPLGTFEICEGECVEVLGVQYCTSGLYTRVTFESHCWILNTFEVVVVPPLVNNLGTIPLCPGDCFNFLGVDYCVPGTYDIPGVDPATGCPNSTIFTIQVNPPNADVDLGIFELCEGQCVDVLGQNYCAPGTYSVTTYDAFGCPIINIFEIIFFPTQVNDLGAITLCPGDCFSFAGSDYCQAGNYDIPGVDPATGCPNSTIFTIQVNPPNADVDLGIFELCEGQCVDVLGQNYCAPGTYSATTNDAFGCPIINIFEIIILPTQVNDLGAITLCPGDCFSFAGSDYCQAGNYDIPGVDPATGCPNSTIFTIQVNPPNADVDLGIFELCEGQCADVLGQNYCAPGTYSVTTYDAFGCPINNIFEIIIFPTQINDLGAITLCPGDCFSFAGSDYCQAGNYDIPGVDPATGCPNSTLFTILIEQPQQIDISLPVPNCNPVTGNYAVSFYMSGTPPFFVNGQMTNNNYYLSTPISSGEAYYFQIYDSSPCNALTPVLLAGTFHCGPLCLSQTGPMNAGLLKICADQIAIPTTVSNYAVAPGDTFEYVLHTAADTTLGNVLLHSPTGHFAFDDNVLDTEQTYYLSLIIGPPGPDGGVDTASPCLKVAKGQPLVFKALPRPAIDITEPTCYGRQDGAIQLSDINLPYTLQINSQTTSESGLSQLSAGDYHLVLTDENGCLFDTLLLIGQPALVAVDIGEDRFISVGESVSLQAVSTISPVTAVWNSDNGEKWEETLQIEVQPMQTTVYTLLIADENGCEASDALTIQVKNEVGIYVPNAFSPNNDGINDGFTLFGKAEQIHKIVELLIFDRWGELVFHKQHFAPNDELLGWDGTTRGQAQSQGVYVYHATVELVGGRQLKLQGEVGLVR